MRLPLSNILGTISLLAILLLARGARAQVGSGLIFVVNRDNPMNSISARKIVAFYEKKTRRWPDGTPVKFIDHKEGSQARRIFLSEFIKKSESEMDLYWYGQKLYTGNSVPIQVPSDGMVLEMVKAFKGGIGYVSAATRIESSQLKVLKVTP